MAGPRLPFELVEARGAKHLTKAEAAQRRDAEIRNPEPVKRLTPPAWLPESQRKEFSRVSQGLILLMPSMISRLDGDTIATYCLARQQWLAASQRAGRALAEGKLEEAQGWSLIQDRCFKAARACATDLTLGHALQWRGQHCFITSLLPFGRNHLKVEAALVAVSECEAAAEMSAGRTELNRPTLTPSTALSFPGVVAEKYRRSQEGDLYTTVETALILNVPKAVPELAEGRTVTIDGPAAGSYEVQAVHNLDPNRVEYEILRKGDA